MQVRYGSGLPSGFAYKRPKVDIEKPKRIIIPH